jgi:hypothetical protein
MPHVHSMTIFGVDRIEIQFVPDLNSYAIKLMEGDDEKTVISVWRTPNGGKPPDLIVNGNQLEEENVDAIEPHNEESDR